MGSVTALIENLDEIGVGDGKRKGGVDSVEDQSLNSFSTLSSGSIKAGKVNTKFHDSRITLDLVDAEGSLHGDYDGGVVHVNKEGNNGFYYHSGDDNNDVDGSDCDENNDGSGCMKDRLFASVEWLEKHVPMCVLHQLSEEIQSKESSLPRISRYKSALLFIDVAGFTRLSQLLDPEDLSRIINSYFQLIVKEVMSFGGDIIKFAGDALFGEWQAVDNERSLEQATTMAAACGARIVARLSDFSVYSSVGSNPYCALNNSSAMAILNVHCGLGAGTTIGIHVGDDQNRREYLISGEPIDQIAAASEHAALGELVASREALELLKRKCYINPQQIQLTDDGKCALIAQDNESKFRPLPGVLVDVNDTTTSSHNKNQGEHKKKSWKTFDLAQLEQFHKLLSLYAHPVVVNNDKLITGFQRSRTKMQQRHSEEAELRSVYVMFVKFPEIRIQQEDKPNDDANTQVFQTLNNIMNQTTKVLARFNGHLRQYIFDDKGLVLIATFGLRGSTSPNMVSERALPATCVLHDTLRLQLGLKSVIGATIGNAYCGVVGGLRRHEYAVLGPSVNLAARLMASKTNPGILVDDTVRQKAGKLYAFNALLPVQAKGYSEPVPIFEPLRARSDVDGWHVLEYSFVGRHEEMDCLVKTALSMVAVEQTKHDGNSGALSNLFWFSAPSSYGKTTLLVHGTKLVRHRMREQEKTTSCLKYACQPNKRNVPLSLFQSIILDLLDEFNTTEDLRPLEHNAENICDIDGFSLATSSKVSISGSLNQLLLICNEIGATKEDTQLLARYLLGADRNFLVGLEGGHWHQRTVDLLTNVIQCCTKQSDIIILAIDDVQFLDQMSWEAVETFFKNSRKFLIICTSRPSQRSHLCRSVRDELTQDESVRDRLQIFDLETLGRESIRNMIANKFNFDDKDSAVSDSFVDCVLKYSNGVPPFVHEILDVARRRNQVIRNEQNQLDLDDHSMPFTSCSDLMIHRIDALNSEVRDVLNVAAIMGDSWEVAQFIAALLKKAGCAPADKSVYTKKAIQALSTLVGDGILVHIPQLPSFSKGYRSMPVNVNHRSSASEIQASSTVKFSHGAWRSSVLKIMLQIRKCVIHRFIAVTFEEQMGIDSDDWGVKMRVFDHWKHSGDTMKTTAYAISIAKDLQRLGMVKDTFRILHETLDIWKEDGIDGDGDGDDDDDDADDPLFSYNADSIDSQDLECIVKLLVAMGECAGYAEDSSFGVTAFSTALTILQECPAAEDLVDRSVVFPVFSGLFWAIRLGKIEQDEHHGYENLLLKTFVREARAHHNPIHLLFSLALTGEMYERMNDLERAVSTHQELRQRYSQNIHSRAICQIYGSDRAAQSYSRSAIWHMMENNGSAALESARFVLGEFFPLQDHYSIKDSIYMIYPLVWVMKDCGRSKEVRTAFMAHVIAPFKRRYGENKTIMFSNLFKPVIMVLDLSINLGRDVDSADSSDSFLYWTLDVLNMDFGKYLNVSLAHFGRCPNTISAEICLLLAERMENDDQERLIHDGMYLANGVKNLLIQNGMVGSFAYAQNESILEDLADLQED